MGFCNCYTFYCALLYVYYSFAIISRGNRAGCFALLVSLVSDDCSMALPHDAMDLSAVCDCGSSCLYSLTIFNFSHVYFFY